MPIFTLNPIRTTDLHPSVATPELLARYEIWKSTIPKSGGKNHWKEIIEWVHSNKSLVRSKCKHMKAPHIRVDLLTAAHPLVADEVVNMINSKIGGVHTMTKVALYLNEYDKGELPVPIPVHHQVDYDLNAYGNPVFGAIVVIENLERNSSIRSAPPQNLEEHFDTLCEWFKLGEKTREPRNTAMSYLDNLYQEL